MAVVNNVPHLVDKKEVSYAAIASKLESKKPKLAEGDDKSESQWTLNKRRWSVQDQRLKSIIMSCLPDDIIKAKPTESLSHTYTRYKTLLNEQTNDDIYGRFVYEDNLIQRRYSDAKKALITTPSSTAISTAFFSNNVIHNFQENSNDEAEPKIHKDYKAEYNKMKARLALLEANPSASQTPKTFQPKNKCLVVETFDWDEEEVSDDEEVTQVKVLMALGDDELTVGKNHARNGEWIDITTRKLDLGNLCKYS
ncbi:hypothetical protein Tco_1285354 [Tanacetum coccineum]